MARSAAATMREAEARRVLARAGYGARPGEAAALAQGGLTRWLDRQLALPAEEPALTARIAAQRLPIRYTLGPVEQTVDESRPFHALLATQPERWARLPVRGQQFLPAVERDRPRLEFVLATLLRRAEAEAQLRERSVEFWHDHFALSFRAGEPISVSLPDHDARIRAHALGNFRALLEAMASSPAMLFYLNNQSSRAGAPNENFARELLELHTLGRAAYLGAARSWRDVPRDAATGLNAGYIDADVWEAARAFTGWSIANGQVVDAGLTLPRTGEFRFVEQWHDPYQKRFLGQELEPFAPPMADGRAVLDLLARHPATARHVCGKLARHFLGDPVPAAALRRAEAAFRANLAAPDQLARTLRALLDGPELASAASQRIRKPTDLVLAAVRAYGIPLTPQPALLGQLEQAGQMPFAWPSPDGEPLDPGYYLSAAALRSRWFLVHGLLGNQWQTGLSPHVGRLAGRPAAAVAAELAALALGPDGAAVAQRIAAAWQAGGRPDPVTAAEAAEIAAWVLTAPGAQLV